MKAAVVVALGKTPVYTDFSEPTASPGESKITVTAASLNPLTKGRASGKHYSSSGSFPFVAGVDGVGRNEKGERVYFVLPTAPFGSMAEKTLVRTSHCILIPDQLDDVTAAAMANPGMSSWAALKERAHFRAGETVLINGATGSAGRLAVQIAKHMGAKKIIATGRDLEVLKSLRNLGADVTIPLIEDGDALEKVFKKHFDEKIDVVLDYLWGKSAERLLIAGAKTSEEGVPIRFVQIGNASGADITLPGSVLRSAAIELTGSGLGSVSNANLLKAIGELMNAAAKNDFKIETKTAPLAKVEETWSMSGNDRIVFTLG
jgi:NADPH:quinone reductase-like Zn-dependent oxidoreductase